MVSFVGAYIEKVTMIWMVETVSSLHDGNDYYARFKDISSRECCYEALFVIGSQVLSFDARTRGKFRFGHNNSFVTS